ncbi:MAG: carboxypeptidase regulatory-like domain-containing protein [Acidobacteria bacterium]|nr:carboxypeptidase regulatory-like domain-containing protein [Acidobacteriota bacterium]
MGSVHRRDRVGSVVDEQKAVLPGATITIRNIDSGQVRTTSADATGNYRLFGLPPGRYELMAELSGFRTAVRSDITLTVAQEARIVIALRIGTLEEAITVTAETPVVETSRSALGTTITTATIEELPIAGRNFATLSQLTPGVTSTAGAGISSSGQLTRNSTFLIDGLSNDDGSVAGQRGGFSVDAIKEFIVVSNSSAAEYGQSSGVIVSVVTRSGTNNIDGRGYYYRRDDSWDASTAASKLVSPTPPKSRLEQQIVGGFLGGPIRQNRMFYFASYEYTDRLTENLVTAPTARIYLPNDPIVFEQPFTNPQFIGKVDLNLSSANTLAVRYRLDTDTIIGTGIGGTATRERGQDRKRKDQDFAPRLGLVWDVNGSGRTVLRGNAGVYYDQVFLNIPLNAENAKKFVTTLITNPGYPDPNGPNPNRVSGPVTPSPSTVRFGDGNRTPYTQQYTIGFQRQIGNRLSVAADLVKARGYGLLRSMDSNYPDLDDPERRRPDPNFQRVTVVETKGNSWYTGLQVGIEKRMSARHSYQIAYTLSSTERNTEDFNFFPVDQRNYDGERGPASHDSQHRLSGALTLFLPWDIQASTVIAARSSLPYNETTGADDNRDTQFNDRPAGVGRNARLGAPLFQADLRLTKGFTVRGVGLDLIAEAFNITNQKNWTGYDGNQRSATANKPTGGEITRQVQLGFRVDF